MQEIYLTSVNSKIFSSIATTSSLNLYGCRGFLIPSPYFSIRNATEKNRKQDWLRWKKRMAYKKIALRWAPETVTYRYDFRTYGSNSRVFAGLLQWDRRGFVFFFSRGILNKWAAGDYVHKYLKFLSTPPFTKWECAWFKDNSKVRAIEFNSKSTQFQYAPQAYVSPRAFTNYWLSTNTI